RRRAVPGIEIAVAEVGEETEEAAASADHERPPCPRPALAQRKLREPEIHDPGGDHYAAERDAVMHHEVEDAAALHVAELVRRHAEKGDVLRKKPAARRLEDREPAAADQREGHEVQQRASVADEGFEEAGIVLHGRKHSTECGGLPLPRPQRGERTSRPLMSVRTRRPHPSPRGSKLPQSRAAASRSSPSEEKPHSSYAVALEKWIEPPRQLRPALMRDLREEVMLEVVEMLERHEREHPPAEEARLRQLVG